LFQDGCRELGALVRELRGVSPLRSERQGFHFGGSIPLWAGQILQLSKTASQFFVTAIFGMATGGANRRVLTSNQIGDSG
jgi:hypothetical protein